MKDEGRKAVSSDAGADDAPMHMVLAGLRATFAGATNLPTPPTQSQFFRMLSFAQFHGIAACMAVGIRRFEQQNPSWQVVRVLLEPLERINIASNQETMSAAVRISNLLRQQNIPCVLLKGAAFLFDDEGTEAWRSMCDLDILVKPQLMAATTSLLGQHGYAASLDATAYGEHLHHHSAPIQRDNDSVVIELHSRLMQDRHQLIIPTESVFEGAVTVASSEGGILIPSPEHRLVHLVAHAQISNWGYPLRQIILKDVADAFALAKRHDLNWPMIHKIFATTGAAQELESFLLASTTLLEEPLDAAFVPSSRAEKWATAAITNLRQLQPAWKTAARIAGHYLRLFAGNPRRLAVILKTLSDARRRNDFFRINRARIGKDS